MKFLTELDSAVFFYHISHLVLLCVHMYAICIYVCTYIYAQYVHEKLMGLTFRISPDAFFQGTYVHMHIYMYVGM